MSDVYAALSRPPLFSAQYLAARARGWTSLTRGWNDYLIGIPPPGYRRRLYEAPPRHRAWATPVRYYFVPGKP
jgi:hypothetical protein